jgi:hypothetical protein
VFQALQVMCDAWAAEFHQRLTDRPGLLDPGLARAGIDLLRTSPATADRQVLIDLLRVRLKREVSRARYRTTPAMPARAELRCRHLGWRPPCAHRRVDGPEGRLGIRAHVRSGLALYVSPMTSTSASRGRPAVWIQVLGALAVAALSVGAWYGWLGWDTTYQIDPITQVSSGPYEAWQVIGCALSLLVVFVGALLAGVRPLVASAALTLAFTAAWTATAAPRDETGLYGVGMILLLVGLAMATAVVSLVVLGLRRLSTLRRRS